MSSLFPGQPIPMPIPGRADLNAPYENLSRSVPQLPAPEIRAFWSGSETPLTFQNTPFPAGSPYNQGVYDAAPPGGLGSLIARGIWHSPTFDLRPDLKAASSYQNEARPIARGSDFGRGARLMLTTSGLNNIGAGFKVYSVEFGSTDNPRQMRAINSRQDITSHFFDPQFSVNITTIPNEPGVQTQFAAASILSWQPAANPIRYWNVAVVFEVTAGNVPLGVVCKGEML